MPSGLVIRLKMVELQRPQSFYFIEAKWHHTIKDVKDMLRKLVHTTSKLIILLPNSPSQLKNSITLHDLAMDADASTVHVLRFTTFDPSSIADYSLTPVSDIVEGSTSSQLVDAVRSGLEANKVPGKTEMFDCTGGVYFMKNPRGGKVGVFKPGDEEQGMANNTKGYVDTALRSHFTPGQGYVREFASYLLDVDNRAQVPTTVMVQCKHKVFNYPIGFGSTSKPKIGSLQQFIQASDDLFEDFGYGVFSDYEVQKIALFDMRVLNCDRNSANILVVRKHFATRSRTGSVVSEENGTTADEERDFLSMEDEDDSSHEILELIPIDHGYCIPTKVEIHDYDWTWFNYPQVDKPVVPELKQYLASINIEELVADISNRVSLPEECWFLIRTVHTLLVEGIVKANLTMRQVASLIARLDDDVPSAFERIVSEASENATRTIASRYDLKTARAAKAQFEARKRIWAMSAGLGGGALTKLHSLSPSLEHNRGSRDSSLSSLAAKDSISSFAISELDSTRGLSRGPSINTNTVSPFFQRMSDLAISQNPSVADDYVIGSILDSSASSSPSSPRPLNRMGISGPAQMDSRSRNLDPSGIRAGLSSPVARSPPPLSPQRVAFAAGLASSSTPSPMWRCKGDRCATVQEECSGDEDDDIGDGSRRQSCSDLEDRNCEFDGRAEECSPSKSTEINVNGELLLNESSFGGQTQYSGMTTSLAGQNLTRMQTLHSFSVPIAPFTGSDGYRNSALDFTFSKDTSAPMLNTVTLNYLTHGSRYFGPKSQTTLPTFNTATANCESQHNGLSAVYQNFEVNEQLTQYDDDKPIYSKVVGADRFGNNTLAEVQLEYELGLQDYPEDGYAALENESAADDISMPPIFNPEDLAAEDACSENMIWASPELIASAQAALRAPSAKTVADSSMIVGVNSTSANIIPSASSDSVASALGPPPSVSSVSSNVTHSSPIRLARVTSFGGFGSDSRFEVSSEEKNQQNQIARMQWSNFKNNHALQGSETDLWHVKYEFDALMTIFAEQAILNIVTRVLKASTLS